MRSCRSGKTTLSNVNHLEQAEFIAYAVHINMTLSVPVALDRNGDTVLPICSKDQGPFKCIECSASLVVRQGEKNQWHFAHVSADDSGCCSGGGESMQHLAAKINFVHTCSGEHKHGRRYERCTSSPQTRYDGRHSADVGVFSEDGKLKAIVEAKFSRATMGEALESRFSHVGIEDTWEVDAVRVLKCQSKLHSAKRVVNLSATNWTECRSCKRKRKKWKARLQEYEVLIRDAAERKEAALEAERK